MKVDTTSIYLIGIIFSVLLAISGFFFRSLVIKLDEGNKTLQHIDKKLAVYEVKLDSYGTRIVSLEKYSNQHNLEIVTLRQRMNNAE